MPAFLLAGAAIAMLVPGGYHPLSVSTQLALAVATVVLLSLAALQLVTALPEGTGGLARWRLGPWYLLWGMLASGLASITWLWPQTGSAAKIAQASVVDALGIFAISVVLWTIGYVCGPPRPIRDTACRGFAWLLRGTTPCLRTGSVVWALYGLGTLARLVNAATTSRFGYVGDPRLVVTQATSYGHLLHIVSTLSVLAVAVSAYRVFTLRTAGAKAALVCLVTVEAGVGALAGWKESFILTALAVLIPYGAVRGKLSLRLLATGTLLFLLIVIPFNAGYRQAVREGANSLTPSAAIAVAPRVLTDVAYSASPGGVLADSSIALLHRVRLIDSVAIIAQLTPSAIPYRNPLELVAAPVAGLIPRAVWPDKPIFASGYRFSQDYYGMPSTVYTSTAITFVGDLYRHGGIPTVGIGMLLLGIGCRQFDVLFAPEKDPRAICFLLAFLPIVVKSEVGMYGLMLSLPAAILTATLGIHLAFRGEKVSPRSGG